MNGTERVRPSSWYYLLAAAFFVGGIGLMFFFLLTDIHRIRESMVRMDVPGELDLDLKRNEIYTVFVEHPVWSNANAASSRAALSGVSCDVHMLPSGETIVGKKTLGSTSYSYGSLRGVSLLEFDVSHDGTYTVACQGPSEIAGEKIQVAIGGGASKAITAMGGKSFLVLIGGIVIGTLIFVRVAMLRLQSRREIREQGLKPI